MNYDKIFTDELRSCNPLTSEYNCQLCGDYLKLQLCQGCKGIRYCGKECQKKDWKRHKPTCTIEIGAKILESQNFIKEIAENKLFRSVVANFLRIKLEKPSDGYIKCRIERGGLSQSSPNDTILCWCALQRDPPKGRGGYYMIEFTVEHTIERDKNLCVVWYGISATCANNPEVAKQMFDGVDSFMISVGEEIRVLFSKDGVHHDALIGRK